MMTEEMRIEQLRKFTKQLGGNTVEALIVRGFCTAPASTKYHGAYDGGLFDHSMQVVRRLLMLTRREKLKWERRESPIIVGMLHDLCKVDQYRKLSPSDAELKGRKYEHVETEVKGHGEKSVIYAKKLIDLTDEETACILNHMGAFDEKENWNRYKGAIHIYRNVLWTHTADMMASHIDRV